MRKMFLTLSFCVALLLISSQRVSSSGNLVKKNAEDVQYIPVSMTPDPRAESWPRYHLASFGCANEIQIVFKHMGDDFVLNMRLNERLKVDKVPVYVGDNLGIHRWIPPNNVTHPACFYQDTVLEASFSIEYLEGKLSISGSFLSKDGVFAAETPDVSPDLKPNNDVYLPHPMNLPENYLIFYRRNAVNVTDKGAIVEERKRVQRATKDQYYVSILAVIDYAVYKRWLEFSSGSETDTIRNLKFYYAHIFNDINTRYAGIVSEDFTITPVIAAYYIATVPSMAPFSEDHVDSEGLIDSLTQLYQFTLWMGNARSTLGTYDHNMLFTGYNIYSGSTSRTGTAGVAYLNNICGYFATSLIEDKGQYSTGNVATHELGHNLGSRHDGAGDIKDDQLCSPNEHYVMTPITYAGSENYKNVYLFSPCSVAYFKKFTDEIKQQARDNGVDFCLADEPTLYDETQYRNDNQVEIGERYTLDQQCAQLFGGASVYCGGNGRLFDVCRSMRCTDPKTSECSKYGAANEKSQCGDRKWCIRRECIDDDSAPSLSTCQYGNTPGPHNFNGKEQTCEEIVTSGAVCYNNFVIDRCCETCAKFTNPSYPAGCEYGDRASWCGTIRRSDCYVNDRTCCSSCSSYNSGENGCEYGDRSSQCPGAINNRLDCALNGDTCCESCIQYETGDQVCKYGPEPSWCSSNIMGSFNCYTWGDSCCSSCSNYSTGNPDCPYGDRRDFCATLNLSECSQHKDDCCARCSERKDCAAGEYLDTDRQTCLKCAVNTYSAAGDNRCTDCKAGFTTQGATGASSCSCPAGSFTSSANGYNCESCPVNTYSPTTNSDRCYACLSGTNTVGNTGSTRCICPIGSYFNGGRCELCPEDEFGTRADVSSCSQCPTGETTQGKLGQKSESACVCPSGYSMSNGICTICAVDSFSAQNDASSCTPCRSNTNTRGARGSTSENACVCPVGYFLNSFNNNECEVCPADMYGAGINANGCTRCPPGTGTQGRTTRTSRDACVCPRGSYLTEENGNTVCKVCPADKYNDRTNSFDCTNCPPGTSTQMQTGRSSESDCVCPAGSYLNSARNNACELCRENTYSTATNANTCNNCAPGTNTQTLRGQTSQSACVCPRGSYLNAGVCELCPPDKFGSGTDATSCSDCPTGTSTQGKNGQTTQDSCVCPGGSFRNSDRNNACELCPENTYGSNTEADSCEACPQGTNTQGRQGQTSSNACVCPVGFFFISNDVCAFCPVNSYSDTPNAASCDSCPTGKTTGGKTGQTSQSDCVCPVGSFLNIGECEVCPENTYNTEANSDQCTPCPYGTTGVDNTCVCAIGSFLNSAIGGACELCPADSYSSSVNSTSCTACPLGRTTQGATAQSDIGACVCPVGYFVNLNSNDVCEMCPVNTFTTVVNSERCQRCPPGTNTQRKTGQNSCVCPAGYFVNEKNNGTCEVCPVNTYNGEVGAVSCSGCPPARLTQQQTSQTSIDSCVCPNGYFINPSNGDACEECPVDTYGDGTNVYQCKACPRGTFTRRRTGQTSVSACVCPSGSFLNANNNDECELCPVNTFNSAENSRSCGGCPSGTKTRQLTGQQQETSCVCPPGSFIDSSGACVVCPEDTFSTDPDANSCTDCPPATTTQGQTGISSQVACVCPAGFYLDAANNMACKMCLVDTYSSGTNANSCTKCSSGKTTQGKRGQTSESECVCQPGTFLNAITNVCETCPVNTYGPTHGAQECTPCPEGTNTRDQTGRVSREACVCPRGSFLNSTRNSACEICPINTYGSGTNAPSCTECPPGTITQQTGQIHQSSCVCPSGSYFNEENGGVCEICPVNTFGSGTNAKDCTKCPPGTITQKLTGQTDINSCVCPVGSHLHGGTCEPCGVNTYGNTVNLAVCLKCPTGTITQGQIGRTSPNACVCPAGSAYSNDGSCEVCAADKYSSNINSNECENCPVGKDTQGLTGQTSVLSCVCPKGSFLNAMQGYVCQICPEDTFSAAINSDECEKCSGGRDTLGQNGQISPLSCVCSAGTYINGSRCEKCPMNTYSDTVDAIGCQDCPPGTNTEGQLRHKSKFACVCPVGSHYNSAGACEVCPKNTYTLEINSLKCLDCSSGFNQYCGCPKGYFINNQNGGACELCGSDTYSDTEEAAECRSCPHGTTTRGLTGRTSSAACVCPLGSFVDPTTGDCEECPVDTFSNTVNAQSCQTCATNTTTEQRTGQIVCNCPAGYYIDVEGERNCDICGENSFSPVVNAEFCRPCPYGTNTEGRDGQTSKDACICPAGRFLDSTNKDTCTKCPEDTYGETSNSESCTRCPNGETTRGQIGQTSEKACVCSTGSYVNLLTRSCEFCPADTYGLLPFACTPCPVGTTTQGMLGQRTKDACVCGKGYYVDGTNCLQCDADTFSAEVESSRCTECPAGKTTQTKKGQMSVNACVCPPGSFLNFENNACEQCPTDTYSEDVNSNGCIYCPSRTNTQGKRGQTSEGDCVCPAGSFINSKRNYACQLCPVDTFSTSLNSNNCSDCPFGSSTEQILGSRSIDYCICPAGYHKKDDGCVICPKNTYSSRSDANSCMSCPSGTNTAGQGGKTSQDACICPSGWYIDGGNGCIPCPADEYGSGTNAKSCTKCPTGTKTQTLTGRTSEAACVCPAGSFLNPGNGGSCDLCPVNSFSAVIDATGCDDCAAGTTTDGLTGRFSSTDCVCPIGSFLNNGNCEKCPGGTYNNVVNSDKCFDCSTAGGQQTLCVCPAGSFKNSANNDACEKCPVDEYSSSSDSTGCTGCPSGTKTLGQIGQNSQSACVCPTGSFINATTSDACQFCPVNTFGSGTDVDECEDCPEGTITRHQTGRTSRESCIQVRGAWSGWGEWSDCSKECDNGIRTRRRSCTTPDLPCNNEDSAEETITELCNTETCEKDEDEEEQGVYIEVDNSLKDLVARIARIILSVSRILNRMCNYRPDICCNMVGVFLRKGLRGSYDITSPRLTSAARGGWDVGNVNKVKIVVRIRLEEVRMACNFLAISRLRRDATLTDFFDRDLLLSILQQNMDVLQNETNLNIKDVYTTKPVIITQDSSNTVVYITLGALAGSLITVVSLFLLHMHYSRSRSVPDGRRRRSTLANLVIQVRALHSSMTSGFGPNRKMATAYHQGTYTNSGFQHPGLGMNNGFEDNASTSSNGAQNDEHRSRSGSTVRFSD